jgi:hypothetical protein
VPVGEAEKQGDLGRLPGVDRLGSRGQEEEAGEVRRAVGNAGLQNLELAGRLGGRDRADRGIAVVGDGLHGRGGVVVAFDAAVAHGVQELLTLLERHGMRADPAQTLERRSGEADEAVLDR